jgi:hypothetical protein
LDTHELDKRIVWKQACVSLLEQAGYQYQYGVSKEKPPRIQTRESSHTVAAFRYVKGSKRVKLRLHVIEVRWFFFSTLAQRHTRIYGDSPESLASFLASQSTRTSRRHSHREDIEI